MALKKENKAMSHFSNVIRLAVVMKPTDVTSSEWYKEALKSRDAIYTRRKLEEESFKNRADAPYRAMITEDLANIKREA